MPIPEPHRAAIVEFPDLLRALIEAELATGNSIVEVGHSWPAPPTGACAKLSRPIGTRARATGDGLVFRVRDCSPHGGEFTDAKGIFFVLEPPAPASPSASKGRTDAVSRFEQSMRIDYEGWRDGVGYDLEAIGAASDAERDRIEALLLGRGVTDWRDVEALAALGTPAANDALRDAARRGDSRVRNAVADHAPHLVSEDQRTATLVASLRSDTIFAGLSQTLDAIATFHPAPVIDQLFAGALQRPGDVAVHLAAMLLYVHEKADEPFDMAQRPFLLRFHAEPGSEARVGVFRELCARLGVDANARLRSV